MFTSYKYDYPWQKIFVRCEYIISYNIFIVFRNPFIGEGAVRGASLTA